MIQIINVLSYILYIERRYYIESKKYIYREREATYFEELALIMEAKSGDLPFTNRNLAKLVVWFRLNPRVDKRCGNPSRQKRRVNSFLCFYSFYSSPQQIGWGSPTHGEVHLLVHPDSNANFLWKHPHSHTQKCLIGVPYVQSGWHIQLTLIWS